MKEKINNTRNDSRNILESKSSKSQSRKEQIVGNCQHDANSQYVDSVLKNLQIDGYNENENQTRETVDFIKAHSKKKQALSIGAAIHLGLLLISLCIAFIVENQANSQLFVAVSIIFAAMSTRSLNNQNQD